MAGQAISHFRILEKLGAGGMGEVYLAEDTRLRRRVALKRMSESLTKSPDARRRFLHEARAAAQLNHPNIAAIYDVIETEEQTHIVMEYVQGESLAARLVHGPVPVEEAVRIGIQVADALEDAHAHGVIHRDLKPANLIITPETKVKVLDFGLAKTSAFTEEGKPAGESTAETSLTAPGMIVGTPAYMSPEQVLGKQADARSDIYGLGVVLFELLAGRKPFQASGSMGLAMAILTERAPAVAGINPNVPANLSAIVARALAPKPEDRYQSAAQLRADLSRLLPFGTELVTAEEARPSIRRWVFRIPGWRWGLSLAVLAVIVVALFYGNRLPWGRRAPVPPGGSAHPIIAVLPFLNLSGDPADEPLCASVAYVLNSNLASVSGVTMVSYASALPYRERQRDLKKIARELGATLLVDGGMQRAKGEVVVPVSLVQAASNTVIWGRSYSGTSDEILAMHQRLAEGLITALQLKPTAAERDRVLSLPTTNRDAFADYSQARNYLERMDVSGNLDRAVQLFKSAVAKDPRFALAHAGLGEAYLAKYDSTHDAAFTAWAQESSNEALRLDPDRAEIRCTLAHILQQTGRTAEAVDELNKAIASQPDSDEAHSLLGKVFLSQGKGNQAIREYQMAIDIRPEYWSNHANLGLAYYDLGRLEEAIASFRRVTELQPDNAWGFQMLGTAYHRSGDTQRALINYRQAIRLGPSARAYSNIGMIYYDQKNYTEAARAYEQAVQISPANPVSRRNLADVYQKMGATDKARDSYSKAVSIAQGMLKVNPKDSRTLALLALCEAKLGLREQSGRHAREAVALSPTDSEVLYKEAVVHSLAGQESEALAALRLALDHGYSARLARADDDLAAIKSSPRFQQLVSKKN
ncbi:MAG: tetratricopeptide repeat protein [Acidobacteriia bacterium]|nr:tetratricopeptide repeat protein [Terriglobia bacterium]